MALSLPFCTQSLKTDNFWYNLWNIDWWHINYQFLQYWINFKAGFKNLKVTRWRSSEIFMKILQPATRLWSGILSWLSVCNFCRCATKLFHDTCRKPETMVILLSLYYIVPFDCLFKLKAFVLTYKRCYLLKKLHIHNNE